MKRRPWPIILLALAHIFAPIGNILINATISPINFSNYIKLLFYPTNRVTLIVFVLIPILAGIMIYLCKKWSYILYVLLMLIPFSYSLQSSLKSNSKLVLLALVFSFIINLLVIAYLFLPRVRKVYFDPKLRWWETKPRYKTNFQSLLSFNGSNHNVDIKNISEGGAFLETNLEIPTDTILKLTLNNLEFLGTVVYKKPGATTGYGFKFEKQSTKQEGLKSLIEKLENEGALIRGFEPGPEDSFVNWVKSLV